MTPVSFTIEGAPRVKKNSRRLFQTPRGKIVSLPSKAHEVWSRDAGFAVNRAWRGRPSLKGPVQVTATFYMRQDADCDNLCASLGDLLEDCRVVADDRLITLWVAQTVVDKKRPRVEVTIQALVSM